MDENRGKIKAIRFTRAWAKNPLDYSLGDHIIPEASSCKYYGIILRSDLNWVDQVIYLVQKTWKALHFVMCVLKKGNRNRRSLALLTYHGATVARGNIWIVTPVTSGHWERAADLHAGHS